jgi:hypothetical protein
VSDDALELFAGRPGGRLHRHAVDNGPDEVRELGRVGAGGQVALVACALEALADGGLAARRKAISASPTRGLSCATVAIDPAPFRGVLPLPISALKSAFPVLGNPANRSRAVPLTYEQFRFGFANAVSEDEAKELYDTYAVPAAGAPLFQAATANLNPWTEAKVDSKTPSAVRC